MDLKTFTSLVDAYGADPSNWPDDRRQAAEDFASAHAAEIDPILTEAAELDRMLETASRIRSGDLLTARILARAPAPTFSDWRQAAAAAALALVVGTAGGYAGGALVSTDGADASSEFYANAFDGLDTEWDFDLGDGA